MTPRNVRTHTYILSLLAFIMALPCFAAVYYVDGDTVDNTNDGLSWATAKKSLQDGIETAAAAANGPHEVWVKVGTYMPDSWPNGGFTGRGKHFSLRNNVAVYGGFAGIETDRNARNPAGNVCILSGDIGVAADTTDNCFHVFYHPAGTALDATAILDGFTVSGGNANSNNNPHLFGGGMYNYLSSPTLTSCTISANNARFGGGIYNVRSSSPILTNCTISENSVDRFGGGIRNITSSSPTLTNCTISGNIALTDGGGMHNLNLSSPALTNCTISANSATNGGGGMYNNLSSPTLTSCTISANSATNGGGGMYNIDSSSPTLTNCTIAENTAEAEGIGVYSSLSTLTLTNCTISGNVSDVIERFAVYNESSTTSITNCILWANSIEIGGLSSTVTVTNSIISNYPLTPNVDNNFGADPLLGPLADNGGSVMTMALGAGSPAIGAADGAAAPATDARGITRDGSPDIGAFEAVPLIFLRLSATTVNESDGTITGTVTRVSSGTSGPLTVSLSSSDTNEATVPASVTILDTQASVDFTITLIDDATVGPNPQVTIAGSAAGHEDDASPAITITDDVANTLTVVATSGGTANSAGEVTVTRDPETSFPITAVPMTGYHLTEWTVSSGSAVIVDPATESTSVTLTTDATVQANFALNTLALSLSATTVNESDGTITGTVTRISGTVGTLTVSLSSSNTADATVPTSVTIPDAQASVDFTITLIDDATVGPNPDVVISASATNHLPATSPAITISDDIPNTLTISAGAGGTASSAGQELITRDPEALIVIAATPSAGYHFFDWTVLSGIAALNSDEPITTVILFTDVDVQANFALDNDPPVAIGSAYPSPTSVGTPVTLSGSGSYDPDNAPVSPITYLWSFVYATPETIVAPTITNATVMDPSFTPMEVGTYTFQLTVSDGNLTDSTFIQVVVGDLYTITANAGTGGTVRFGTYGIADTSVAEGVASGADSSYLFALQATGYEFSGWDDLDTNNPRLFQNVTAETTVAATFVLKSHTVTFTTFPGGTLSGDLAQTADYGTDCLAVTATANAGYKFLYWSMDGEPYATDPVVTVTNVQADMTIVAVFQKIIVVKEKDSGCSVGGSNGLGLPLVLLLALIACLRFTGATRAGRTPTL